MDRFVNPYTFVPLGDPVRRCPMGHRLAEGRFSGTIDVTVTLDTPLLLTRYARNAWVTGKNGKEHLRLPGSSVKGAVRALHEAAFNGCLRVVDTAFTPGYREPATTSNLDPKKGWTLAVVLEARDGRPLAFQPCDPQQTVWVDALSLLSRYPSDATPTVGDLVDVVGEVADTTLDRWEVPHVDHLTLHSRRMQDPTRRSDHQGHETPWWAGGEADTVGAGLASRTSGAATPTTAPLFGPAGAQVFLVTDTAARKVTKRSGQPARCLWASSVLTQERIAFDPLDEDKAAYDTFRHAIAGSADRRLLDKDTATSWRTRPVFTDVRWQGRLVGRRAAQTGVLFRGDVVWVRVADGRVRAIRLAALWRKPGRGKVGERIRNAHPCLTEQSDTGLCLSCETFGAADASEGKGAAHAVGPAEQRSYAGHVRFGALVTTKPLESLRQIDLAPLSTPNPGSGAFYLDLRHGRAQEARDDIASHWGSRTDEATGASSTIRGRKFYWHADPDAQQEHWAQTNGQPDTIPRYQATQQQIRDDAGRERGNHQQAHLVPAGTTLSGTVTVDALPKAAVQALLASLDPRRLLEEGDDRDLATHLGGGKPLGLGSATVTVTPHLHTVAHRYAVLAPASHDFDRRIDPPSWSELTERTGMTRDSLQPLLRILDRSGLGSQENLVSYPPSAGWSRFGTQPFRASFAFFQQTNGQALARGPRDWQVLPHPAPDSGDVSLPIYEKGGGR